MVALSCLFTALGHVRDGKHGRGGSCWQVLCGRLPPVLVDAVLELDDGEIADLEGEGPVEEDGLDVSISIACGVQGAGELACSSG